MEKIKKISRWAVPAAMASLPFLALAALVPTLTNVPGTGITLGEIETIIRNIATFLVVISIILAVVFIIIGGIMYMAERGNDEMVEKAKKTIFNGIIGALVVLAVGVILQTLAGIVARSFFN